jgi:hypothetical protein
MSELDVESLSVREHWVPFRITAVNRVTGELDFRRTERRHFCGMPRHSLARRSDDGNRASRR